MLAMLALVSCEEELTVEKNTHSTARKTASEFDKLFYEQKDVDKRIFGEALVESMNQSKKLREIIKAEALKEFNNETDVLFVLIKDKMVEDGTTVRELMGKNMVGDTDKLDIIINDNPTLTIFVPELPEKSFSAAIWEIDGEVPAVAIRLQSTNDVPLIGNTGDEEVIPSEYIPGFPVLVIKDNERIVNRNDPSYENLTTDKVFQEGNIELKYIDDIFDVKKNPKSYVYRLARRVDPTLEEAYNLYQNVNGWQRDYIYYGIHQNNPEGPMSYDFQEHIGSFSMIPINGDARPSYNKIADQTGDPRANEALYRNHWSHWTDGQFDFSAKILINSTAGAGVELIKYFPARPDDLFLLKYTKHPNFTVKYWTNNWYSLQGISSKTMLIDRPIVTWDIENKSVEFKISLEEIDLPETTTDTQTHSSKFATNFEISPSLGEKIKVGMKFGASQESTQTHTITKTISMGSDKLGDCIVTFGEDVIIGRSSSFFLGTRWRIRDYSTGDAKFTFEPKRVQ